MMCLSFSTGVTVRRSELSPLDGSKGEANFIVKFKGHSSQSYIKMVDIKGVDGNYTADQSGTWVTILAFECRGLDILRWKPEIDFVAVSASGNAFENVDLSSGDWAEFEEEGNLSISVMNVETKVE